MPTANKPSAVKSPAKVSRSFNLALTFNLPLDKVSATRLVYRVLAEVKVGKSILLGKDLGLIFDHDDELDHLCEGMDLVNAEALLMTYFGVSKMDEEMLLNVAECLNNDYPNFKFSKEAIKEMVQFLTNDPFWSDRIKKEAEFWRAEVKDRERRREEREQAQRLARQGATISDAWAVLRKAGYKIEQHSEDHMTVTKPPVLPPTTQPKKGKTK